MTQQREVHPTENVIDFFGSHLHMEDILDFHDSSSNHEDFLCMHKRLVYRSSFDVLIVYCYALAFYVLVQSARSNLAARAFVCKARTTFLATALYSRTRGDDIF